MVLLGLFVVSEGYVLAQGYSANHDNLGLAIGIAVIMYLIMSFAAVYCQAGLLYCVITRMQQQPSSVSAGFRAAGQRLSALMSWSCIQGTIGCILHSIENAHNIIESIVAFFVGVAWAMASFFVLPFILFEKLGAVAAIKSSVGVYKGLFTSRAYCRVRLASLLLSWALFLIIILGFVLVQVFQLAVILKLYLAAHVVSSVVIGVGVLLMLIILGRLFHAIVTGALFLFYAKSDVDVSLLPFSKELLEQAFLPRKGKVLNL